MAPYFPYPNSINDCYAVVCYVLENANELNVDLDNFILAGDSAGKKSCP